MVVQLQSLVNPTLLLESDKSKEVTLMMQYLVNPTLILGGDAFFDHVLNIYGYVPSEQGRIPLSPGMFPPSPRMVSFDWNDTVDDGSSANILSSLDTKVLGSLKLLSTTSVFPYLNRSLA
jgi:hypothetical protein